MRILGAGVRNIKLFYKVQERNIIDLLDTGKEGQIFLLYDTISEAGNTFASVSFLLL